MGYVGGKAGPGIYQRIICQFPPHRVYVEPFLGGGAILRAKRPAERSYGLDLDPSAIAAYGDTAGTIAGPGDEIPQPGPIATPDGAGLHLQVGDALDFLRAYPWRGDELVYCDPPYLAETRRSGRTDLYRHDRPHQEFHADLLQLLRGLPCMVAISGYENFLYRSWLQLCARPWRVVTFPAMTRGGHMAEEWLWMNYPEPVALHDYRYLGADFRERERIKRKTARWRAKLAAMPLFERRALLAALDAPEPRQT